MLEIVLIAALLVLIAVVALRYLPEPFGLVIGVIVLIVAVMFLLEGRGIG